MRFASNTDEQKVIASAIGCAQERNSVFLNENFGSTQCMREQRLGARTNLPCWSSAVPVQCATRVPTGV